MKELSQQTVMDAFTYHPDGYLMWKSARRRVRVGSRAGCRNKLGRWVVMIDAKLYLAYRLIFLYHHGYMPHTVDHVNRDCSDDRIGNLREATSSENHRNARKRNTQTSSGFKGVCWSAPRQKWRATIYLNGKQTHLGYFNTEERAAAAYDTRSMAEYGEFAAPNELLVTTK